MEPFFNSAGRVQKLLDVAQSWRGTPWCANSFAPGPRGGVSCHNLPREMYVECGALPPNFMRIYDNPNGTKHRRDSVMEPFLNSRPEFRRLKEGEPFLPGDLLGLRIYHCVDHLGIFIGRADPAFVHVLMHKKTDFDLANVPPWSQRILAAWRPLQT